MAEEPSGYRGRIREILSKSGVRVGDLVRVARNGEAVTGILMPRYELADDNHIVLKLKNGYNIGVRASSDMVLVKVGEGVKPDFKTAQPPGRREDLPTVVVLSTGGTIASRIDYRTGAVYSVLSASNLHSVFPELSDIANIRTDILFNLLSENVYAPHWSEIVERVADHVNSNVDGVVVCHGTDTLAYTAAALSFALQRLPVPVILVGSQRSSDRPSSDASLNLINAVIAAAESPVAEVAVCMHETISDTATLLHRGTRVRKCHTSRRDAFKSVNSGPLARIEGGSVRLLRRDFSKRDPDKKVVVNPRFDERVALLKFHPGLSPDVISWLVEAGYLGIVFEGTGLGHVAEYLFQEIGRASEEGLAIAMTSQCIWGRLNMSVYSTGMDLQRMGVMPLEDMMAETALVKMMWAFGQTGSIESVRRIMLSNIAGEMGERSVYKGHPR